MEILQKFTDKSRKVEKNNLIELDIAERGLTHAFI